MESTKTFRSLDLYIDRPILSDNNNIDGILAINLIHLYM